MVFVYKRINIQDYEEFRYIQLVSAVNVRKEYTQEHNIRSRQPPEQHKTKTEKQHEC